jgi:nucleoside-diphosphate-sugar epimerase
MKVLLTGNEGYLGACAEQALIKRNHEVTGIDSGWFSYPVRKEGRRLVSSLTAEEVEKQNVVIHLAWFSSAGNELSELQNQSLAETETLVDLCNETDTKLVFASTASVYGYNSVLADENTEPNPVCPYGCTKLIAERYIQNVMSGGKYVILRKGTLMGIGVEGERARMDLVANAFIEQAYETGVIKVFNPETQRPILHVEDAADAYVMLAEEDLGHSIINLAHKNYTVLALAHWIDFLTKCDSKVEVKFGPGDDSTRSYQLDCSLAKELKLPMEKGIHYTIEDFKQKYWVVEKRTTKNVQWMKELLKFRKWLQTIKIWE